MTYMAALTSMYAGAKKQLKMLGIYNAPAKPGRKASKAFNEGMCTIEAIHPNQQHICAYWLVLVNRMCPHSRNPAKTA